MNVDKNSILAVIPARYSSTRLEGKPLKMIGDKTMIEHVYNACKIKLPNLLVATDNENILNTVESFGGNAILTNPNHETGTNRCLEAYEKWSEKSNKNFKYVLNIQGDEPLLSQNHIEELINCFKDKHTSIATLALATQPGESLEEGKVYLTKDDNNFALYFSRFPIPFLRDIPKKNWTEKTTYYQHIGIYGFTTNALQAFCKLNPSKLENNEKLEQLRWLEAGKKIKVGTTKIPSYPVDTFEDLEKVRKLYQSIK